MRDRSDYLTQAEQVALENGALRQHARTVETYLSLAALTALSDEQVQAGIDHIRTTDKREARRLRDGLFQAVATLETLLKTEAGIDDSTSLKGSVERSLEIALPATEASQDVLSEQASEVSEQLDMQVQTPVATPETVEVVAQPVATKQSYLEKLLHLSESQLAEVSPSDAAAIIYEMAGSPAARRNQSGLVVDLVVRLERRLAGMSIDEIAEHDKTTPGSVNQWFVGIQSKLKKSFGSDLAARFNELLARKQSDASLSKNILVGAEEPEQQSAFEDESEVDSRTRMLEGTYDDDHVMTSLESILGRLDESQREALGVWVSTDLRKFPPAHYSNAHVNLARLVIDRLPKDFEGVGVAGSEKTTLRRLLGMYSQSGRPVYRPPETAEQILHKADPNTAKQFASGVGKLLNYLEQPASAATPSPLDMAQREVHAPSENPLDIEALLSQVNERDLDREQWLELAEDCTRRQLKEHFNEDESDILWKHMHYGPANEHLEEPKNLSQLLKKVEVFFIEKNGKERRLTDKSSSMFKMFFMTFQGVKSLDDIYAKFNGRDETVTRDEIERSIVAELHGLLRRD